MVFITHNSLKLRHYLIPYLFHIFQDPCFSRSRFFRGKVFEGLGLSGSRFFRVRDQGPGPGFRSSRLCEHMKKIRSNQALQSCTELSKTQIFPVSIVKDTYLKEQSVKVFFKLLKKKLQLTNCHGGKYLLIPFHFKRLCITLLKMICTNQKIEFYYFLLPN